MVPAVLIALPGENSKVLAILCDEAAAFGCGEVQLVDVTAPFAAILLRRRRIESAFAAQTRDDG
jgi:hypothetical protein